MTGEKKKAYKRWHKSHTAVNKRKYSRSNRTAKVRVRKAKRAHVEAVISSNIVTVRVRERGQCNIHAISILAKKERKELYAAFLDLDKIFDSVPHEAV